MATKGNGIFLVYTDIDSKFEEEFNAWYNTEHLGELLNLPGFLDAARYVAEKGGPKYLAAYELTSADALKTAEFQKWRANPSPWSRRMSPTVIGKNVTRILGQQIFRLLSNSLSAAWHQRSRSGACPSPTASIKNGTPGTTVSTFPAIAKCLGWCTPGVIASSRGNALHYRVRVRARESVGIGAVEPAARDVFAQLQPHA